MDCWIKNSQECDLELGICASIKHKYNVDTVPHVLCGGFTKEETEYLLVDCHYLE